MEYKSNNSYSPLLTKSKYMVGLQCPKYLWILFHEKHRIPEADEETQHRFDQGHLIGELAKKLWRNGIDVNDEDFIKSLKKTEDALKLKVPLFEAGFKPKNERIYSRADILEPAGKDEWDIIEVKSSTEVKDENIDDVAFQKYCYEKAGLKIRKCFLMHINNEYVRKGEIKREKIFVKENITSEVLEKIEWIPEKIKEMLKIIDSKEMPNIKKNLSCKDPYECPLVYDCWDFLPENNIFNLYRGKKKELFELLEAGVQVVSDIPSDYKLNDKQKIQHQCEKTNKPYIDKKEIKKFLLRLKYPLYFLDFETIGTAIPLYDNAKPYQQIPFQFSLHVIEKESAKPKHYSYLADGNNDPREEFIEKLKKLLGTKGSIIVYNQGFEQGRLNEIAEFLPKYQAWVNQVTKRMVDLLKPFRDFCYYHPKQKGSCSIKKVLPALTGKSYEEMEIAEGGTASLRYLYSIHGSYDGTKATPEEVKKIREDLEKYCILDTQGMIWIVEKLREKAKGKN
ncbi:MAG: DUF2779 domain-containing protein [Nanoarchaeota archaeon]|nr:DUF2779 domain-containing protein [Nanoarchaeota archaeon]